MQRLWLALNNTNRCKFIWTWGKLLKTALLHFQNMIRFVCLGVFFLSKESKFSNTSHHHPWESVTKSSPSNWPKCIILLGFWVSCLFVSKITQTNYQAKVENRKRKKPLHLVLIWIRFFKNARFGIGRQVCWLTALPLNCSTLRSRLVLLDLLCRRIHKNS